MSGRRRHALLVSAVVLFANPCSEGVTGDCTHLGGDPLSLRDGALLFRPAGSNAAWSEVLPGSSALANQTIDFTYVLQEKLYQKRSGVAVIKTGRTRQSGEQIVPDAKIPLTRDTSEADAKDCPVPPSLKATVGAQSYDDYHNPDHGRRRSIPDQAALDNFHYKYAGFHDSASSRSGGCKKTNSASRDARTRRTNLGQFSFDPAIVAADTRIQLVSWMLPSTAVAGTETFADREVAMHAYATRTGFPSCIRFQVKMPAAPAFVRINDLEGLKQDGQYYIRGDEFSWESLR